MNIIIRILRHLSTTCSFVSTFLTTYRTEMAVFGNYEIHLVIRVYRLTLFN